MNAIADLPRKTRELHNHHMDSTVWNDFPFRDDDVIVATYAKAGTTWMQQIVAQLIFKGDPDVAVSQISPWWDMRIIPPEVREMVHAQTHRRVLKTTCRPTRSGCRPRPSTSTSAVMAAT
jgi:aryl sulfotransferase